MTQKGIKGIFYKQISPTSLSKRNIIEIGSVFFYIY